MKLLTKAILNKLPALYATEDVALDEKVLVCKFFHPCSSWTWYAIEGEEQGDDFMFFGYVEGFENELGYFSLNELKSVKKMGLGIERDRHFKPVKLKEIIK